MTPNARVAAAIEVLDQILAGAPAERALLGWSRASRFAGSGDRAAVRDLVFDALRCRSTYAALGGALNGRALMLGRLRSAGENPAGVFNGEGHAPAPLTEAELSAGDEPDEGQQTNLPDWIWPLWSRSLQDRAQPVAAAMAERAPVWLRVNSAKTTPEAALAALAGDGIEAQAAPRLPTALRVLSGERRINGGQAYRDGLVELQDLSPQLASAILPLSPGQRVLDYCAGGGGKALAVAARAKLRVEAHDADPGRMLDLPNRAARAGADIRVVDRPKGPYDLVIADVPCSGSGTWRRTPDAKWRFTEENLQRLIQTQQQILSDVAPLVGVNGHLAYMTCSVLTDENDAQIERFLSTHKGFQPVCREVWTPLNASDGFYLALLHRQE